MRLIALAAAISLGGLTSCRACSRDLPDASPPAPADGGALMSPAPAVRSADVDAGPPPDMQGAVRFDCAGVAPAPAPGPCGRDRHEVDGLIERAEFLTEVPARHKPPPDPYWSLLEDKLARAEQVDGHQLEVDERIAVQNAALHLALEADATSRRALARRALGLARRYAFPAATRPESVEPAADLDLWLGPRSEWTERTRPGFVFHQVILKNTRVFRFVRTPRGLANFGQLVALDDMGRPFVTRVVSGIEMRIGASQDAPACVVIPSPSKLRCSQHAGLEVVTDPRDLPQSHFTMNATRTHIGCNGCHGNAPGGNGMALGLADVPKAEVAATLTRRRAEALEALARAIAEIDRAK
jgi:hypothetical protein